MPDNKIYKYEEDYMHEIYNPDLTEEEILNEGLLKALKKSFAERSKKKNIPDDDIYRDSSAKASRKRLFGKIDYDENTKQKVALRDNLLKEYIRELADNGYISIQGNVYRIDDFRDDPVIDRIKRSPLLSEDEKNENLVEYIMPRLDKSSNGAKIKSVLSKAVLKSFNTYTAYNDYQNQLQNASLKDTENMIDRNMKKMQRELMAYVDEQIKAGTDKGEIYVNCEQRINDKIDQMYQNSNTNDPETLKLLTAIKDKFNSTLPDFIAKYIDKGNFGRWKQRKTIEYDYENDTSPKFSYARDTKFELSNNIANFINEHPEFKGKSRDEIIKAYIDISKKDSISDLIQQIGIELANVNTIINTLDSNIKEINKKKPKKDAGTQPGTQPNAGTQPGTQPNAGTQPGTQPNAGAQPGDRKKKPKGRNNKPKKY